MNNRKITVIWSIAAVLVSCLLCGAIGAVIQARNGAANEISAIAACGQLLIAIIAVAVARRQAQIANDTFFESERPYVVATVEADSKNQTYVFDIGNYGRMVAKDVKLRTHPNIDELIPEAHGYAGEPFNIPLLEAFSEWLDRGVATLAPGQHLRTTFFVGSWFDDALNSTPSRKMPELLTFSTEYRATRGRKSSGPFADEHVADMRSLALIRTVRLKQSSE